MALSSLLLAAAATADAATAAATSAATTAGHTNGGGGGGIGGICDAVGVGVGVPLDAGVGVGGGAGVRQPPKFEIRLDTPPRRRYDALVPRFNATVWRVYRHYCNADTAAVTALALLAAARGPEPDDELQQEVEGMAEASGLPLRFVQGMQMLYELQTLQVPIVNFSRLGLRSPVSRPSSTLSTASIPSTLSTLPTPFNLSQPSPIPPQWQPLTRLPWRGPGCTGIIATSAADGTVSHARNLDFAPVDLFAPLVYTAIFTRQGVEVFRSQMIAGYASVLTGMRRGPDGYAVERNTRFPDAIGGNVEMLERLVGRRPLNGWVVRKVLETESTYAGAVTALSATPFVATEYLIISGVRKGVIVSRSPDAVAYAQTLGRPNFETPPAYVIATNFDFFFHDVREYFDASAGQVGRPRRIIAQRLLNATAVLTPEVLYETLNTDGVIADTIFQAVINVEKDVWNVSQPDLRPKGSPSTA